MTDEADAVVVVVAAVVDSNSNDDTDPVDSNSDGGEGGLRSISPGHSARPRRRAPVPTVDGVPQTQIPFGS